MTLDPWGQAFLTCIRSVPCPIPCKAAAVQSSYRSPLFSWCSCYCILWLMISLLLICTFISVRRLWFKKALEAGFRLFFSMMEQVGSFWQFPILLQTPNALYANPKSPLSPRSRINGFHATGRWGSRAVLCWWWKCCVLVDNSIWIWTPPPLTRMW